MNLTLKVGDSILQNAPSPWADFMDSVGMHLRELTAEEQSIGARGLLVIQVNPKNPWARSSRQETWSLL